MLLKQAAFYNLSYSIIVFVILVSTTTVMTTQEKFRTMPGKASFWIGSAYAVILLILCLAGSILIIHQKSKKAYNEYKISQNDSIIDYCKNELLEDCSVT